VTWRDRLFGTIVVLGLLSLAGCAVYAGIHLGMVFSGVVAGSFVAMIGGLLLELHEQ
jgi:hypothetical protein